MARICTILLSVLFSALLVQSTFAQDLERKPSLLNSKITLRERPKLETPKLVFRNIQPSSDNQLVKPVVLSGAEFLFQEGTEAAHTFKSKNKDFNKKDREKLTRRARSPQND